MPLTPAAQPGPRRQKYEATLNEVLDETHKLLLAARGTVLVDDSRLHGLIRHLRDEFGPEAKA